MERLIGQDLLLEKGLLRKRDHVIQLDAEMEKLTKRLEGMLEKTGLSVLDFDALKKRLELSEAELNRILGVMDQQGRIIRTGEGIIWSMTALKKAWEKVKPVLKDGQGKTMSQLREVLGCPRRYAVSLMETFDRLGLTQRVEDLRFKGSNYEKNLF